MPSLETLRRRKLLTQAELAAAAGVSTSTVYVLEREPTEERPRPKPRLTVMRKLSRALGVDAAQIDEFRGVLDGQ